MGVGGARLKIIGGLGAKGGGGADLSLAVHLLYTFTVHSLVIFSMMSSPKF